MKTKLFDVDSQGDNEILAAVSGRLFKIYRMEISAYGGANTVYFKSGSTQISPKIALGATGDALRIADELCVAETPWYLTALSAALNLTLSAGTAVAGQIWYEEGHDDTI